LAQVYTGQRLRPDAGLHLQLNWAYPLRGGWPALKQNAKLFWTWVRTAPHNNCWVL